MANAPITMQTTFETRDGYSVRGFVLPEGSTGQVLKIEDGRVRIEWCYALGSAPWAGEDYINEWVDLDDWSVWVELGFEEPDEVEE